MKIMLLGSGPDRIGKTSEHEVDMPSRPFGS